MKKSVLLFCLLGIISITAKASHLMGGDITLYNDSGTNYTLTLQLYRDINGIPLATYAIVDVFTYDAISGQYLHDSTINISENTALSTSLLPFFPYNVEVGVYTYSLALTPGKYQFVYNTSARNAAILNATTPASESLVLYTNLEVFSSAANSTPKCILMPVAYFPINVSGNYNPLPYDVDGDSLTWSLNTPIGTSSFTSTTSSTFTSVVGFTTPPAASTGPFTMNSVTGEITWTPNTMGNFIQSFEIDEYRGGIQIGTIIRDMQYVIVNAGTADSLSMTADSSCMFDVAHKYNYTYYTPGQPFSFKVSGISAAGNNLTMSAFGGMFDMVVPATFTSSGTGSNISGTLHWTPDINFTKDIIVVFRLRETQFTKDYTLLLRKNPNANGVNNIPEQQCMVQVYPNPVHNSLNVSIDLAKNLNGDISLYSILGEKVATIYSGKLEKGSHNLNKNIDVAAGMYYLVVRDNGIVINTKHIVVQ